MTVPLKAGTRVRVIAPDSFFKGFEGTVDDVLDQCKDSILRYRVRPDEPMWKPYYAFKHTEVEAINDRR